jgi:hypothetical protein
MTNRNFPSAPPFGTLVGDRHLIPFPERERNPCTEVGPPTEVFELPSAMCDLCGAPVRPFPVDGTGVGCTRCYPPGER